MGTKQPLLIWSGILTAFWVIVAILVIGTDVSFIGAYFSPELALTILGILVGIAGAMLALLGKVRIAPWLILSAFLLGEFLVRALLFVRYGSTPGGVLRDVSFLLDEIGALRTAVYVLGDLAVLALLAAVILSLAVFFRASSTSPSAINYGGVVMSESASGGVPAGWYADPNGMPVDRYWDGSAWGEQTRPRVGLPQAYGTAMQVTGAPRNGMGVAALVLGILGLLFLPIIFSILAIIFGSVGIGRANRGEATNKGMAVAGLVLGIIGLVIGIVIGIVLLSA